MSYPRLINTHREIVSSRDIWRHGRCLTWTDIVWKEDLSASPEALDAADRKKEYERFITQERAVLQAQRKMMEAHDKLAQTYRHNKALMAYRESLEKSRASRMHDRYPHHDLSGEGR